jgi:hypothetical protein
MNVDFSRRDERENDGIDIVDHEITVIVTVERGRLNSGLQGQENV